jgi:uncharacterized protein YndB with AHSA1/START domain
MAEVRIDEILDAPRDVVFAAWTDADQVADWWAPAGLEIPRETVTVEPWPGGRFELTMVDQTSGARHEMRAEFVEISEPELIVLRTEPIPDAGILEATVTRIVLEADGDRTRMTVTDGPYTEEFAPNAEAGWRSIVANLGDRVRA